jgi:Holliday junction resolvase RusA-like endonuclease
MGIVIPILGEPIAWQRPAKRLMYGRIITWDKQAKEKEMVRWQLRSHWDKDPIAAPVRVDMTFKMSIPKSASRKAREQMLLGKIHHMKVPDVDNIAKFYMDCLSGIVVVDDKQVWSMNVRKVFSEDPCVMICIVSESLNGTED